MQAVVALLLAQAAGAIPAPPPQQDIEVIGRHLSRLRLSIDRDGSRLTTCRITVSSGDALIDAAACPTVQTCLADAPLTSTALLACTDQRIAAVVATHDTVAEPAR